MVSCQNPLWVHRHGLPAIVRFPHRGVYAHVRRDPRQDNVGHALVLEDEVQVGAAKCTLHNKEIVKHSC